MLNKPEAAIVKPLAGSDAATEATIDNNNDGDGWIGNYDGIDFSRLRGMAKPLAGPKGNTSWIYKHGWRV
jgi:hypothetical protein